MTLVDEGDLLATVEPVEWLARDTVCAGYPRGANVLGALGVLDALDLDEARLRVHPVLATLVAQVATPK